MEYSFDIRTRDHVVVQVEDLGHVGPNFVADFGCLFVGVGTIALGQWICGIAVYRELIINKQGGIGVDAICHQQQNLSATGE